MDFRSNSIWSFSLFSLPSESGKHGANRSCNDDKIYLGVFDGIFVIRG